MPPLVEVEWLRRKRSSSSSGSKEKPKSGESKVSAEKRSSAEQPKSNEKPKPKLAEQSRPKSAERPFIASEEKSQTSSERRWLSAEKSRERRERERAGFEPLWALKPRHDDSEGEDLGDRRDELYAKTGKSPPPPPKMKQLEEELRRMGQSGGSKVALAFGIAVPILLIIVFVLACCCWRHRRKLQKKRKTASVAIVGNQYLDPEQMGNGKKPTDPWELHREDVLVHYDQKLGSGAFADVYIGQLIGEAGVRRVYRDVLSLTNFHDCPVAVKVLPPFADDATRTDFQKEIAFMKSLKYHPHLVCLMGYVADATSPLLLIEYCSRGDLLRFVRDKKEEIIQCSDAPNCLKVKNLVSFSWQIANGLEYLNSMGCIHRDVAARNVLLDESNVCKIGDFGLCRLADSIVYTTRGGRLPIRWMSPESLTSFEYSMKSDVWSYGVLLYELFTFGEIPYAGMENAQILEFLEAGNRLPRPPYCTDDIYEVMTLCWRHRPADRLSFTEICLRLMRILESANADYGYVTAVESGGDSSAGDALSSSALTDETVADEEEPEEETRAEVEPHERRDQRTGEEIDQR